MNNWLSWHKRSELTRYKAHLEQVKQQVFELSMQSWQRYCEQLEPIPLAWMRTVKRSGSRLAIADAQSGELSGHKVLSGALLFSRLIRQRNPGQRVGLLLPTSSAALITNMAALISGKTVVNLNYTAAQQNLLAAVEQAELQQIFTSRRFVEKLQQRGVELEQLFAKVEVIYLEDLKQQIPFLHPLSVHNVSFV